jgi:hypothetical protein
MLVAALTMAELGVARAEAAPITWHWSGPVSGYSGCTPGFDCGTTLDTVVPLGTTIDVSVSLDPERPPSNPQSLCNRGTASASLQVLGRTYTSTGFVWDEGHGFGPGVCVPGFNVVEVVVPLWGFGGPALPGGWVPFHIAFLPGLWWDGDLTSIQPTSISSQFPEFRLPGQSAPQRFTANLQAVPADLQAVPEPTTWLLLSTGLAAAAWRRRRQ